MILTGRGLSASPLILATLVSPFFPVIRWDSHVSLKISFPATLTTGFFLLDRRVSLYTKCDGEFWHYIGMWYFVCYCATPYKYMYFYYQACLWSLWAWHWSSSIEGVFQLTDWPFLTELVSKSLLSWKVGRRINTKLIINHRYFTGLFFFQWFCYNKL